MKYILHNYRRCPFCIRVRIMLYLKDVEYEVIEEPLRKWTQWMIDWSSASGEESRIPVLRRIHENGEEEILIESNIINQNLDAGHGVCTYTPDIDSSAHGEMETWLEWCDTIFKHQIDRFKYGENLEFDREKHGAHTTALREMIQKLEDVLCTQTYLLGDVFTIADIAIIPFVRQIMRTRNGEFDFEDFPAVTKWVNEVLETDWFQNEVMKKYPLAARGEL